MKISTRLVLLLLLTTTIFNSFGQNVISTETFPNPFNTSYETPINKGFYEAIGKFIAYTPDKYSVVAVDDKKSFSSPYALRLCNYSTENCTNESTNRVTGPIIDCTPKCPGAVSFQFKIFNLNVSPANDHFFLFVLVSKDNGANWTTLSKKSAAELVSAYGSNKWSDVNLTIPAEFLNSQFRYRFIGCMLPGSTYENCIYIDDIKVVTPSCGPVAKLRLGNQVWNDRDGDGKRDENEPAIGGAPISLYTDNNSDNLPDGAAIRTTQSDAQGHYLFTDLPEGRYIASMPILPGYQQSPNNTTGGIVGAPKPGCCSLDPDADKDNDNNLVRLVGPNAPGGVVYTNAITLTANQEPTTDGDDANGNLTFDLAECGNSAIGDFVWRDLNGNGIQDAGEPGINGVLVTITFPDGRTASVLTHTYNAPNNANAPQYDGYYDFLNLGPGTYKITFATPAGLTPTPANRGTDDAKDSDPVNGGPVTVTLAANESNFTIDAGFCNVTPPVAKLRLGNQVWNDRDGDGKRDENEPAIGGVTISLYTDNNSDNLPDGAAIRTTQSDVQGHYLFTDLPEGRYIASMPIIPGYQQSPNNTTGGIVGAPKPGCCSLDPDADKDNDNNLVRLVGPNAPGGIVYTNAITLTAGGEPTTDGDDANGNLTFDLAECGNSAIGDFVWNDLNGNGIQDAGEPGINGVLVTITFEDGRTASVLTHNYNATNNANAPQYDGYYDFINLGPGTYKITFATPAGLRPSPANVGDDTKDSDPVNGAPVTVTLAANQSNFTIDAGFTNFTPPPPPTCPNLSLGNMVFNDTNGNGVKEANEQGIAGLTVKLYADNDGNNVPDGDAISTIMTAADGTYYFGNLAAGKYIVGVTTGNLYTQNGVADATPDDNKDNDNNGVRTVSGEVRSNYITLSPGDEPINDGSDNNSNLTLDFGLKSLCGTHCDCHNDCTHTGCGHPNCSHNNCKNDCNHTTCGHPNCSHNSCKNDCNHKDCGHPNCAHNSCKNDCDHKNCGHSNCGKKNNNEREDEDAKTEVSVYPNPATDHCDVKVNAIKSGTGQIRITDASGHLVLSKEVKISAGSNTITIRDLGNVKSGSYNVQLLFDYHVYNEKLMLVK